MRSIRLTLASVAVVAVVGACGGSTSAATPKATAADASSQPAASAATEGGGSGDSGSGGSAAVPKIEDATYKSGKTHVSITGEKSLELDGTIAEAAGAMTIGGSTVLQYALPSDAGFIQISFLQDDSNSAGIAITDGDFVVAGEWGQGCDVTFARNDASGLAGDFTCKGLTGVDTKLAKAYKVDMEGSFQADR